MDNPIEITPTALEEIKSVKNTKNIPSEYGLRVGLKGGGCGATYLVGFDQPSEQDLDFDLGDGVKLFVDKRHLMYLMGVKVDFYDGSDARGFTVSKV